jgi:hypothetical protein
LKKALSMERLNKNNTPILHMFDNLRINPPKFDGGLIFEHNPREIGFAFYKASAETCPPLADWAK